PTGDVELQVDEFTIVSRSTPLPFQLDEEGVDETLRLRYRWLDLRREKLQRNLRLRARMVGIIRRHMEDAGYLEIQTPILYKSTPEGARDFIVPSRLHKGRFFALPQSPQILKQLTMIAGFDRYYQIAICFRDEDLRADRVQEITQLDVEMSFPDREELFATMEEMFATIWWECLGVEIDCPWPRMTFAEADRRFGTDKPDTRFGLELEDATALTRGSGFGVFASADAVRFLRLPRTYSRAELGALEEIAKERGAKGLAYLIRDEESGELRSPITKFLAETEVEALGVQAGETLLFAAGSWEETSRVLGHLRLHLGRELGLIDDAAFTFLWVTDFPMFEWSEDERRWSAVHHPFTRPTDEWRERFHEEPGKALAYAYDIIVNGNELGGGSFRIHEPDLQARVFDLLALTEAQQRAQFGFLLDALGMGAPPHGGIALGIDRMTMVLAGEPNLRDVIAFPKNQAGLDPMSGAPSPVTHEQLAELGIALVQEET
ncbi:MAG: aspartate--tRNA ligase, partial [Thermoleophilia bacterium]|nr:aspartate--tRNA ligase [Thermoleophilia bacterium]